MYILLCIKLSKNMTKEELTIDMVLPPGPYLYWIDDDGEWLGVTPYKENLTDEEIEHIKEELRRKRVKITHK